MQDFLNQKFYGNTIYDYLVVIGIFLLGIILITIFRKIVLIKLKKWSERSKTTLDDFLIKGIEKSLLPVLYILIIYSAIKTLSLNDVLSNIINKVTIIIVTFFILKVITSVINYSLLFYIKKKSLEEVDAERRIKQIKGISVLISFVVWAIGLVFLLDNLGFEISAVIAGLGIGGIAIALAAQTILGDLFSYFVIFFDRPFEIGDFIILNGDFLGSVEYIGIKTTRIRSLTGEQIVVSNTDLTNSRIKNFKRMERRRIVFNLRVTYQTSHKYLKEIPLMVKKFIEEQPDTLFDRAHFQKFSESSLDFEFVYYVLSSDYNKYMDTQQAINLKIHEEFEKQGIEFAYPTRTIFLNNDVEKEEKSN